MRAAEVWKRCPIALRDTLPAWLLARVIVLASLGAARFVIDEYPRSALARNGQVTLIGWDAGIYTTIARFGYAADPETYRFFPLYPLASRALDVVTPGATKVAIVILATCAPRVRAPRPPPRDARDRRRRHCPACLMVRCASRRPPSSWCGAMPSRCSSCSWSRPS